MNIFFTKYTFDLSQYKTTKIINWIKIDGLLLINNVVVQIGIEPRLILD